MYGIDDSIGSDAILLAEKIIFYPGDNLLKNVDDESKSTYIGNNESRVLFVLINNKGNLISRNELHQQVWGNEGLVVDDSSVVQSISILRKLLSDNVKSPIFIKTIPKHGYQLIAQVTNLKPKDKEENGNIIKNNKNKLKNNSIASYANRYRLDSKKTFAILVFITSCVLFSISVFYSYSQPSMTKVGVINGADVYTVAEGKFMLIEELNGLERCIDGYLDKNSDIQSIEKVVVARAKLSGWIMNIISDDISSSVDLVIVSDLTELSSVCNEKLLDV